MLLRLLSSLVLIPVTVLVVWQGGILCVLFVILLVIATLFEMCQLTEAIGANHSRLLTAFCSLLLCLPAILLYTPSFQQPIWFSFSSILFFVLLLSFAYQVQQGKADFLSPSTNFVNSVCIGWGFGYHVLKLRRVDEPKSIGFYLILFLLIIIWSGDTSAYLVGKQFGQHKLRSDISPGKTIEGTIAGLVGSVLAGVSTWYFLLVKHLPPMTLFQALVISLIISITSQLSDLSESIIKRNAGVKDSGYLIPGHGGILDRLDSMIFATPAFYYCLQLFRLI